MKRAVSAPDWALRELVVAECEIVKYTGEAIHLIDRLSGLESAEEAAKRDERDRTWSCEERPAPERGERRSAADPCSR